MAQGANALSRNPNVCAFCSSLADGMGESNLPAAAAAPPGAATWSGPEAAAPAPAILSVPATAHVLAGHLN